MRKSAISSQPHARRAVAATHQAGGPSSARSRVGASKRQSATELNDKAPTTERKKQKAFHMEGLLRVARLAGFEPTTPWFVAKYSIQLSYSRTQDGATDNC